MTKKDLCVADFGRLGLSHTNCRPLRGWPITSSLWSNHHAERHRQDVKADEIVRYKSRTEELKEFSLIAGNYPIGRKSQLKDDELGYSIYSLLAHSAL